jgi:glyoxylase-like metal-dependent hydrolase (beta-lactamase superfamily II)
MTLLRFRVAAAAVSLVTVNVFAQVPDLSDVTIVTTPLGDGMYMLEATGDVAGNIAVSAGEDGILIVDDQFAGLTDQILDALREVSSGQLRYIVNTHHHDDHSDGNASLVSQTGATVIGHDNARQRLLNKPAGHWPTITTSAGLSIHFNGQKITALAVPGGHTDNDIIVFFEPAGVVHMGDLFNSARTSFPLAHLAAGGNALRILDNIERILPMIPWDAQVIAGHGPLSDRAGLVDLRDMLAFTINFVQNRKKSGRSLGEIQAEGFPAEYDEWAGYITADAWIAMIYESLP